MMYNLENLEFKETSYVRALPLSFPPFITMGRSPSDDAGGLKKGPWTAEEDQKLTDHIQKHGLGSWKTLPKLAGLNRCGKSCRLRWANYLRPDIRRGNFSDEEEKQIIHLHSLLGNKWSAIAVHLEGRTDNEIKNYWNTHLRKKLIRKGIDPITHQPRPDLTFLSSLPNLLTYTNITTRTNSNPHDQALQTEIIKLANINLLNALLDLLAAGSTIDQNCRPNSQFNPTHQFNSGSLTSSDVSTGSGDHLSSSSCTNPATVETSFVSGSSENPPTTTFDPLGELDRSFNTSCMSISDPWEGLEFDDLGNDFHWNNLMDEEFSLI